MGKPGKISDPDVQDNIRQVREACGQRKKPIGIFAISVEDARTYSDQGYTLISVGVDTIMLGQVALDIVAQMRRQILNNEP